jgi:hypothetical protein
MQDPLLKDIRRARAERSKALKRDFKGAIAESNELFYKLCDVIVSPTGERRYVASAEKAYDVLIAPRLAREKRRPPRRG